MISSLIAKGVFAVGCEVISWENFPTEIHCGFLAIKPENRGQLASLLDRETDTRYLVQLPDWYGVSYHPQTLKIWPTEVSQMPEVLQS